MEKKTNRALSYTAAALGGLSIAALAVGIGETVRLLRKSVKNQELLLEMLERQEDRIAEKVNHNELMKRFEELSNSDWDEPGMQDVYASPEVMGRNYPDIHGETDIFTMGMVYDSPEWDLFD